MATRYGEGFTPEQREAEHLQEIDGRLQTLLSPAVFTSISSTSLLQRTIPNTVSSLLYICVTCVVVKKGSVERHFYRYTGGSTVPSNFLANQRVPKFS